MTSQLFIEPLLILVSHILGKQGKFLTTKYNLPQYTSCKK